MILDLDPPKSCIQNTKYQNKNVSKGDIVTKITRYFFQSCENYISLKKIRIYTLPLWCLLDIGKWAFFLDTNTSLPNVENRMHAVQNIRICS
jgi:hypothetical protein